MLENTEEANKNRQSRETGKTKTNITKTQHVLNTTIYIYKQTQIRNEPSHKQLEAKTNLTSFLWINSKTSKHGTLNVKTHNRTIQTRGSVG
jgi:hypothetical protein